MKPAELLSVNLAITDLGAAVSMYPLAVASLWNHSWLGGDVTCIYYGWMGFFFGVASVATLTVMAVVRFTASMTLHSHSEYCRSPFLKLDYANWKFIYCLSSVSNAILRSEYPICIIYYEVN